MNKKRIVSLVLCIIILFITIPVMAADSYTVKLTPSASKVERGKNVKVTVSVYDLKNISIGTFWGTVDYDSTVFEGIAITPATGWGEVVYNSNNGQFVLETGSGNLVNTNTDVAVISLKAKENAPLGSTNVRISFASVSDGERDYESSAKSTSITIEEKAEDPVIESYTVSFNTNGGSSISSQKVEKGEAVTKPSDPTRSGYTFDGWYADSSLTTKFDFTKGITANTTVYAKWTKNSSGEPAETTDKYTVKFNTNGGSTISSQIVEKGKTAAKPSNPTRSGYTFDGWYADSSLKTKFDFTKGITANTIVYAKWIASGNSGSGSSGSGSSGSGSGSSGSGSSSSTTPKSELPYAGISDYILPIMGAFTLLAAGSYIGYRKLKEI